MLPRFGQRLVRNDLARRPGGAASPHAERFADCGLHVQVDRHAPLRIRRGIRLAHPPGEFRVVGLPDFLPRPQLAEIDGPAHEGQFHQPAVDRTFQPALPLEHIPHAAALLGAAQPVAFEGDAVASLDRPLQADLHPLAADLRHLPQQHTAVGRTVAGDQPLVIVAQQPTGREAAREGQLHSSICFGVNLTGRPANAVSIASR